MDDPLGLALAFLGKVASVWRSPQVLGSLLAAGRAPGKAAYRYLARMRDIPRYFGEQTANKRLAQIIVLVRAEVEKGVSLSAAMAKHPKAFNRLFVAMVKAGEVGGFLRGDLGAALRQLEAVEAGVAADVEHRRLADERVPADADRARLDQAGVRAVPGERRGLADDGTGADRQLGVFQETGSLTSVVDYIQSQFLHGIGVRMPSLPALDEGVLDGAKPITEAANYLAALARRLK